MDANPAPARPLALFAAFATCTLIWGSTFLFISIGNDTVPPVWAAALRLLVAAAILVPLSLARGGLPRGAALSAALWYGLFQFGLNLPLLYWGETVVPSSLSAVIFASVPLTTALFARAFGLERLTRAKVIGAVIAIAGVGLIFSGQPGGRAELLPILAIVMATLCACLGAVLLKRGPRQSPFGANAVATAVGFVVCTVVSLVVGEPIAMPTTWPQIYPILYLAIAGSVAAFVIFTWMLNQADVSRISYIAVISPIMAMALGHVVRHERLTPMSLLGSAVVLFGLLLGFQVLKLPSSARPAASERAG